MSPWELDWTPPSLQTIIYLIFGLFFISFVSVGSVCLYIWVFLSFSGNLVSDFDHLFVSLLCFYLF